MIIHVEDLCILVIIPPVLNLNLRECFVSFPIPNYSLVKVYVTQVVFYITPLLYSNPSL